MTAARWLPFFGDRRAGEPVAATASGALLTLAEMDAHARALAAEVGAADALVSLADDRLNVALSLLAALHADVPCLMPHDHAAETVRRLRSTYPRACFVTDGDGFETAGPVRIDRLSPASPVESVPVFPGDRIAARVFTSGTTGCPTGHDKRWSAFAEVGDMLGERLPFEAGMRVVATVPGQHVFGIEASIMLPLRAGGVLQARRPLFPGDIAAALATGDGPAVLVTTPVHLRALLRSGLTVAPPAFVLSATAPLDSSLAAHAESVLEAPVYELYGCTEAGAVATRRTAQDSVWRPCRGVRVRASTGGRAEVIAPYLAETVHLADCVSVHLDGRFTLEGRASDLVNVAGKRGSLGDITARVLALPGVEDAVVHLPADNGNGQVRRLVAFVVAPGREAAELRACLRDAVDQAFMPRPLVCVDALPRNAAGKITRASLEAMYRDHLGEALP